ncbi:hypothetical protein QQS21_007807 [Conoideocrella luteorostrata]|uniref:Uncharacterized protein n=1 Tax=Conoideocrella luteorostrata TaxID=1105319 RepID=A0AAJ0FRR0_9HYPO|nr:hypothetical protein QQS21_007807 [Conoideocrella luteorostrata]
MADSSIVFITGANTGIGFETVKALVQSPSPYYIFMGSRDLTKAGNAIVELKDIMARSKSTVEPVQIDVTDDESIQRAAETVQAKFGRIDVLINNAGAHFERSFTADSPNFRALFNKAYDINVTGAQVTTTIFAPLLLKSTGPRLIFLTSGVSTLEGAFNSFRPPWAPSPKAGWPKDGLSGGQGYKSSKAALNMCMLTWHWILKEDGVKTFAISPGLLATNLGGLGPDRLRAIGAKEPFLGGDLVKRVVEGERDDDVGRVISQDGVQPF